MTAIRVVDNLQVLSSGSFVGYAERLNFIGSVVSASMSGSLDVTITAANAPFLLASASAFAPPDSRVIVAGPGIIITDDPIGHTLTIGVNPSYIPRIQWNETPAGVIDISNRIFTLEHTPSPPNSLMFFMNGVLQKSGSSGAPCDYVLSGSTIMISASLPPRFGDNLLATYQY